MTIAELDAMPAEQAHVLLQSCCGAPAWVRGMLAERPFRSHDRLLAAADDVWYSLGQDDWLEAFAHHPQLGEQRAQAATTDQSRAWSATEQVLVASGASDVRVALANANREYAERFGYICIICATGLGAEEILRLTRARLGNAPDMEIGIAASEQGKITRLRLERLVGQTSTQDSA